jgi:hypothetical protein
VLQDLLAGRFAVGVVGIGGLRGSQGGRASPASSITPLRLQGRRNGTLSFRMPPALLFYLTIDLSYLSAYCICSAAMQLVTSTARRSRLACPMHASAVPMGAQHTPSLHYTITLIIVVHSAHVAYIHLLHSVVLFTLFFHMSVPFIFKRCSVHPNKALYSSPVPMCELPRSPSSPPRLPSSPAGVTRVSPLPFPHHFADMLSPLVLSLCSYPALQAFLHVLQ